MKLLILDANQRSALAATRSLGSRGIPVTVADEMKETLAGASKYCMEKFAYPSPNESPQQFIEALAKECASRNITVMFPMTEITTYLVLKHRNQFKDVVIPYASFEIFDRLTDKWRLFELARELGVLTPETFLITNPTVCPSLPSYKFPVVLKPYRSRILLDGKWRATSVNYAYSLEELKDRIHKTDYLNRFPFMIQEFIGGEGRGLFAIYDKGEAIAFFAHRRLREKPPSGGISVLCESVEVDPVLLECSRKILDHVHWHGVAMVEFKVSPEGKPYLMEVNARFWGSLQLAISAGIDFPWLLYQIATGKTPDKSDKYKIGIKNRWLLGDLDHLYLTFKNNTSIASKLRSCGRFLNFFSKNTHYEINRRDDLKPFFFEMRQYFRK